MRHESSSPHLYKLATDTLPPPALKWFPAGSVEPVDYGGGRDLESLVGYVTNQAGVKSSIKPPPPPAAVQLDVTNFDDVVNGSKNVIVAFTAPWCGHCKNMKPAYEAVARAFINEPDVVVAQMQADAPENKDIAMRYDVRSFPTIKFFPKNSTEWISYDMARTEGQFTVFLNEQCGTHRTASGLLDDAAGRVAMLDALARKYVSDLPSRADIAAKTKEAIADVAKDTRAAADYYVKAMERIAAKGDAWLKKESTRLTNLLASPTIAPKKLDEIKVKLNILKAFVEDKAEDLKEEAEKVAKDIKDEL